MRVKGPGRKRIANATPVAVVDYGGDPYNEPRMAALQDEIAMRLQGVGVSGVYGGEKGDPSRTWNGYAAPVQTFHTLGVMANPIAYRDPAQGTMETGLTDAPYTDPARRIFAQRLARRGGMS